MSPDTPNAEFSRAEFFVGIDVASESLYATLARSPQNVVAGPTGFTNDSDGFDRLAGWLAGHKAVAKSTVVCMEATGVYCEALCYYLYEQGYRVAVEDALRVKRAFKTSANKTDPADSRQIAEYACRYLDELRFWRPNEAVVEQVKVLLSMREQLVRQRGAKQNALRVLRRKAVQAPAANRLAEEMIAYLKDQIKEIEAEIRRLIREHPTLSQTVTLLLSVPGVGMLLAANLLVVTGGFEREITARQLSAYIGICPYDHVSGTSVKRRAKSRPYGPPVLRKLLYLAALTVKHRTGRFERYYLQKRAEGKPARLVLNNIANKLLRIICAVLREGKPYYERHRSINPALLKNA